ncbi:glycosyltransferase [Leifsonia poae]|uniref:glycosyltransferase n=1 Tax=Leifsonia poae TaxID=110933 RepID=UPI001CBD591F|nr:glycosyltransferase family 2 protein [Leifsonia poae]
MPERARFAGCAVVVVNYASTELLAVNLAPLARDAEGLTVVVVDNASSASERSAVSALAGAEGWATVLPATNLGFGLGMNAGVEKACELGADRFLLLNPDASIGAADAGRLFERVAAEPLTLVSPRVLRPDGSVWFAGADLALADGRMSSAAKRPQPPERRAHPWLSGACLCVSAELWDRVGGFADGYFLYWEDVELSYRVVAVGGALDVAADAVAVHAEGGTQRSGQAHESPAKSNGYYYFNIRNRLLFAARNLGTDDLLVWRRTAWPVAWEILLQGGRRQFLRSLRPFGAAARALRDGRRIVRDEMRARALGGRPVPEDRCADRA